MGLSADGNRLLFTSSYNPTGENPDGNFEYYFYHYLDKSIHQISSRTGFPIAAAGYDALSANGLIPALVLPSGADYPPDDLHTYMSELELFKGTCTTVRPRPSNLRTTSVSQTEIGLAWNDNANDESQYRLERSENGTNWTEIASLNASSSSFTDTGLSCSSSYLYRVRAYWGTNPAYSEYSNISGATTSACPPPAYTPSNLHSTNITTSSIDLAWNDNASNETAYTLERSFNNGISWTEVASLAANSISHSDSVVCNTSYQYRVRVSRMGSNSYAAYSNVISVTSAACVPPIAPSELVISNVGQTSISLSWVDNSSDESQFRVERSTNGGTTWNSLSNLAANTTSYSNIKLSCETNYQYRVRAYKTVGNIYSEYSNVVSAITTACLPAPTNLEAVNVTRLSIQLAWEDNATDESLYSLERSTNDGSTWSQYATFSSNAESYTNNSLTCSKNYQYRVRAYRVSDSRYSVYSNTLLVSTAPCLPDPLAPSNAQASTITETSLRLSWEDTNTDENSYNIAVSANGGVNYTFVVSLAADTTSHAVIGLECGKEYQYFIYARRNEDSKSSALSYVTLTTLPCTALAVPANFRITNTTNSGISFTWDDIANETTYSLERSLDGGSMWTAFSPIASNQLSFVDSDTHCETSYHYRLRASGNSNTSFSDYSSIVNTTTGVCPFAPSNLQSTGNGVGSIALAWGDTNSDEGEYRLERSLDGVNWTQISSISANTTVRNVTGLSCGTSYYFRMRAYRYSDDSYSAYSNVVNASPVACLLVPTNLRSTSIGRNTVTLAWDDTNSNESAYRVERSTDNGATWSQISSLNANTTSYPNTELSCDTLYQYRVRANRSGDGSYSDYSNVLSVTTSTCPLAPTNLLPTSIGPKRIDVTWVDNATDESVYIVEISSDGIYWSNRSLSANSTSYSWSPLSCGTEYHFRVRVVQSSANGPSYSAYSNVLVASTSPCPAAPTNLTLVSVDGHSIQIAWEDNATTESYYYVERSTNGTYYEARASLNPNTTSYTDSNLTCGTVYYYYVQAYDANVGYSAITNILQVSIECIPLVAPSNLRSTNVGPNLIGLAWDESNSDESNILLERSLNNGSTWTQIEVLSSNTSSFTNSSLLCNSSYQYRVRVSRTDDSGYSPYSDVLALSTLPCVTLATPTGLSVSSNSQNSILIAWTDTNADESNFQLQRSSDNGLSWTLIASPAAGSVSYNNTNLSCAKTFQYRIRAFRAVDNKTTDFSNVLTASTAACPLAPSNLHMTANTQTSIAIGWTDNATDESSYRPEYSIDGGSTWSTISGSQPSANSTSYTHDNLTCGTSYHYRIRAYRSSTNMYSDYSNVLLATAAACPPSAPTNLVVLGFGSNNIHLSWTDNANDETAYRVYRKNSGSSQYSLVVTLNANMTAFNDKGLQCGSSYSYHVEAYRIPSSAFDNGASPSASIENFATAACSGVPLNLRTTSVTALAVGLAWDDNSNNETSFVLERYNSGSWQIIAGPNANITSYTDSTVVCGQSYQYRIRARLNDASYTVYSNVISVAVPACSAVNAPTGLSQSSATASSVGLSWTDNATDESNYRLEYSSDNGTSWTQIAILTGTSYVHNGLSCERSYQYRVRAYRNQGNSYSAYSNVLTASSGSCPVAAPSNAIVTANTFGLSLSWTDNASNESDFELQASNGGNWQTIASLPANTSSFNLTGLLCQTSYSYRLRAYKSSTATYSAWLSITGSTGACPALQASVLSHTSSDSSISLSWTIDSTAQSFTLSYSNGVQWFNLGSFNSSSSSYTHSGLACGQSFQYQILSQRSQDAASIVSNSLSITTAACAALAAPAAPVVLSSQAGLVTLQIPAMPIGASSMSVERSQDGVNWTNLGYANSSYADVNVSCNSSYHYRLVAFRASDGQFSPASAEAIATTAACPVAVPMVIGVYHAGSWSFVDSNATSNPANSFAYGDASWQALVGDWDGDGVDGIGLYRNGEFILRSVTAGLLDETRFNFGSSSDFQAVAGDWDGDGIDSVGLFGNGQFILSNDNSTIHYHFNLGDGSGWMALAGDWDGNGVDGLALYKEGLWLLVDSAANPVTQTVAYGPAHTGWMPVAGDWDGNGTDTIGLYNNGLWRVRLESNTGGIEGSYFFGTAGDTPLSTFEGGIPGAEYSLEAFIAPSASPEQELVPEISPEATPET